MLEEARATAARVAEEGPTALGWLVYVFVFVISALGGVTSYMAKVRRGEARPANIFELLGEIASAALAGVITFWLCEWAGTNKLLEAALIAIAGHMGSRALVALEVIYERFLSSVFAVNIKKDGEDK